MLYDKIENFLRLLTFEIMLGNTPKERSKPIFFLQGISRLLILAFFILLFMLFAIYQKNLIIRLIFVGLALATVVHLIYHSLKSMLNYKQK